VILRFVPNVWEESASRQRKPDATDHHPRNGTHGGSKSFRSERQPIIKHGLGGSVGTNVEQSIAP
jgi:hypothetical protein